MLQTSVTWLIWNQGVDIVTAHQRSCRIIMFSLVSVCSQRGGGPMWPISKMHWASLYRPPSTAPGIRHGTWWPLLLTSGGHHWRPVQTCSFEDLSPHWYWHLVVEALMVGKPVVRILLECFLFNYLYRHPVQFEQQFFQL